ncbi:MAG: DNA-3-methyladenine glycosylase 2 family protein [Candidatus Rokubacteria bacterium]|nr:DNA-3-methyladenine glycosylase 2 family protein [Candidatus Rokubacteria bacterium]
MARTLARFHLWGEDPANSLGDGVFRRAVRVGGRWYGYELRWAGGPDDARVTLRLPGARSARALDAAVAEARQLCGLELDLPAFYQAARRDPVLGALVPRLYGLRPTLMPQPLEMLVGAVCAQQVNLRFAFTVRARLVRGFGTPVAVGGHTVYAFPDAERLARAQVRQLRAMQFTGRKAEYIIGLARQVASGALDLDALRGRPNGEVMSTLTAIRGFGRWTAEWFLARSLGRGDVCPAGDLAVRKAFAHFFGRGRLPSEAAVRRRAAAWGGHQNLAVHYLLAGQRLAGATAGGGT